MPLFVGVDSSVAVAAIPLFVGVDSSVCAAVMPLFVGVDSSCAGSGGEPPEQTIDGNWNEYVDLNDWPEEPPAPGDIIHGERVHLSCRAWSCTRPSEFVVSSSSASHEGYPAGPSSRIRRAAADEPGEANGIGDAGTGDAGAACRAMVLASSDLLHW